MSEIFELKIPGKPQYVGTVRMAIASIASNAGFDIEAIDDIKVAVSEACTNIVCHSHVEEEFSYNVKCRVEEDRLIITVKDDGKGYNVEEQEEVDLGDIKEGGLGLFIIKALMDEVDVTSEIGVGTNIQMVKRLQKGA